MATFLQLQNLVESNVIDLPTAVQSNIAGYINKAMRTLQTMHDFKVMEKLSGPNITTVATRTLLAAPSDFIKPRGEPWFQTNLGQKMPMSWAADRSSALSAINAGTLDVGYPQLLVDAEPSSEANARNFEVFPLPDGLSDFTGGEYRVYIPYWRQLTDLSADGDTNWFTVNAEEWLEYAATAYAFYADWDEVRGALWEKRAEGKRMEVISKDKKARLGAVETLVPLWQGVRTPRVRL